MKISKYFTDRKISLDESAEQKIDSDFEIESNSSKTKAINSPSLPQIIKSNRPVVHDQTKNCQINGQTK
jgi:hypothetical protein